MDIIRNPVGHSGIKCQVTALSIAMGKTVSDKMIEFSFYLIFGSNEPVYAHINDPELAREYTGCIVPLTSIVVCEGKVEKKSVKGYVMEVTPKAAETARNTRTVGRIKF
ncbi:hypothetical protein SPFM12_00232 [Salmonella phage SPFM12]|nr:hypothetical protein SPFM12_00232 [Salmonella phage SPFM12]